MSPNRIIVGEVRGKECLDMLNAMNTGHDGSISTGQRQFLYGYVKAYGNYGVAGCGPSSPIH